MTAGQPQRQRLQAGRQGMRLARGERRRTRQKSLISRTAEGHPATRTSTARPSGWSIELALGQDSRQTHYSAEKRTPG